MKYSIAVYSSPQQGQGAWSAYRFACAALADGHTILRIFFYHDGVYNGDNSSRPAQDENNLVTLWSEMARSTQVEMLICISAAKRRGVFDDAEARRHASTASLAPGFSLAGLGQYSEALLVSDRLITFGR